VKNTWIVKSFSQIQSKIHSVKNQNNTFKIGLNQYENDGPRTNNILEGNNNDMLSYIDKPNKSRPNIYEIKLFN